MSKAASDTSKKGLPIASMLVGILSLGIMLFTVFKPLVVIALGVLAIALATISLHKRIGLNGCSVVGLVLGGISVVIPGLIVFSWHASDIFSGIM